MKQAPGLHRVNKHCVKWSVEGAVVWSLHRFIHSLCRSHPGLVSLGFDSSSVSLGLSTSFSLMVWAVCYGSRLYAWPTSRSSSLQALLWPSNSVVCSHMRSLHIISDERCLCKQLYMERGSLQCLERTAAGRRWGMTNWQQKRGIQLNVHFVLIWNPKMQLPQCRHTHEFPPNWCWFFVIAVFINGFFIMQLLQ